MIVSSRTRRGRGARGPHRRDVSRADRGNRPARNKPRARSASMMAGASEGVKRMTARQSRTATPTTLHARDHSELNGSSSLLAIAASLVVSSILVIAVDPDVAAAGGLLLRASERHGSAPLGGVIGSTYLRDCSRGRSTMPAPRAGRRSSSPSRRPLTVATPLIFAGLGLGVGFRAGLFNIGAQGQIIIGALMGGYIGFACHLPVGPPPHRSPIHRRHHRRRALGLHPRSLESEDGGARGHHRPSCSTTSPSTSFVSLFSRTPSSGRGATTPSRRSSTPRPNTR